MPASLHGVSVTSHTEGLYRGHEPFYCEEMHTFGARKKLSGKAITYLNNNRFLCWGGFSCLFKMLLLLVIVLMSACSDMVQEILCS